MIEQTTMDDDQLIGSFYFKRTTNGNLLGEYSNNKNTIIFTESCNSIENQGSFDGNYQSSWREGSPHYKLDLNITRRSASKFISTWREDGNVHYRGEGFLVDDILIGHYVRV